MRIYKQRIVDHLRSLGHDELADRAEVGLPDEVDSEANAGQLLAFGIDPTGQAAAPARRPPRTLRVRLAGLLTRPTGPMSTGEGTVDRRGTPWPGA